MKRQLLLILLSATALLTSHLYAIKVDLVMNKRFDVTPQNVMTQSSKISCAVACVSTSWCASANLSPDTSTCQMLSEEVSDEASLDQADGWTYIRKLVQKRVKNRLRHNYSIYKNETIQQTNFNSAKFGYVLDILDVST